MSLYKYRVLEILNPRFLFTSVSPLLPPQSGPSFKSWTKGTSVICVGLGPEFDTLERKKDIPQVHQERRREGGERALLRFNRSKGCLLSQKSSLGDWKGCFTGFYHQKSLQSRWSWSCFTGNINNQLITVRSCSLLTVYRLAPSCHLFSLRWASIS